MCSRAFHTTDSHPVIARHSRAAGIALTAEARNIRLKSIQGLNIVWWERVTVSPAAIISRAMPEPKASQRSTDFVVELAISRKISKFAA